MQLTRDLARLAALVAAGLGGCSVRTAERPDVVLVLVDTLRADRLGCLGNERGLTPAIDRLAAQGVLFEAASSHAPWTLPATASLFTSLPPRQHGAGGQLPDWTALAPDVETLAEHFADAGYATGAVFNVAFLGEAFGLTRGFEHVDGDYPRDNRAVRRAERTTDAALAWIDARPADRPFFLVVHYFDPHALYDPPRAFRERFAEPRDREGDDPVFGTREDVLRLRLGQVALDPELVARAEALYDGEVAYVDTQVERLLDRLDARPGGRRTVVALTADHGEEFLDHGGFEHGHTLYQELLHVPLVLRWSGGPSGLRVDRGVAHVDVAPSLCELAGLPPMRAARGTSLLPLCAPGPTVGVWDRPVYAHGNFWAAPLASWREGPYQLIRDADGAFELYDWRADPGERDDLAAGAPETVARLGARLAAFERSLEPAEGEAVELGTAERAHLDALGYSDGRR